MIVELSNIKGGALATNKWQISVELKDISVIPIENLGGTGNCLRPAGSSKSQLGKESRVENFLKMKECRTREKEVIWAERFIEIRKCCLKG